MKRLNKILIIFFVFNFFAIYGGWRFIHSKKFSDQASLKVSKLLTKKIGARLSFTGVDFSIFPPSTVFKNVHLEKNDPRFADIDLEVDELRVAFAYASFFSSELQIDELALKNGKVSIVTYKNNSPDIKWQDLNINTIFEEYSDLLKRSPLLLNIARLEDIKLKINESSLKIEKLSLAPHKKNIRFKIQTTDIHFVQKDKQLPVFNLDSISTLLEITKDECRIESLRIENGLNNINFKTTLFNQNNKLQNTSFATLEIDAKSLIMPFSDFFNSWGIPKEFKTLEGIIHGEVEASGSLFDPDAKLTLSIDEFKSDWIELQSIKSIISKNKKIINLEKLSAKNNSEYYELLKSLPLFDIKKNVFMQIKAPLEVRDAYTNTFLYSLKNTLEALKGYITGQLEIAWDGEKIYFRMPQKVQVSNFKLLDKKMNKAILQNSGFQLDNTTFSIDKKYKLSINAKLLMANSVVSAFGEITEKDLKISIKDSRIDMKSFGPIADLNITGDGAFAAEIYGPFENVTFDFNVDWNNFSIVDLNFGKVKSLFSLSLKNLEITIHELVGVYNQSHFTADGLLSFGNKSEMDLKLDFSKTNFSDARKMYSLIFKNIKLPVIPEFNFTTSYRLKGGYDVEKLNVEGAIKGTDLKFFNEEAERFSLDFSLRNSLLSFNNMKMIKSRGELNSNFSINLQNNYTEFEGRLQGLRLRDFNLYKKLKLEYDGDLDIEFDGNGVKENFTSRFKTKITNAFIENIPASPSSAVVYLNSNDVAIDADLLSGKIKIDTAIDIKTRAVLINAGVETNDMREILGIVAAHNMADKNISGKIKAKLETQFNIDTLKIKKFFLSIAQFNLKKGDVNVAIDSSHDSVILENGIVKKWDLRFTDGEDFFTSRARNISETAIAFDQSFSIKASAMEFATASIEKAFGVIKGTSQFVVDKKIVVTNFILNGTDNLMKIKNLPGAITNLDYSVVKKGNIFEISKFSGKYGGGEMKASGSFVFDALYPNMNIEYKIERSNIPLFKRSNILVSSSGTITGKELPYKLNGKISLLHGEFLDDPADFTKENKVNIDNFKKYLPQKSNVANKGYLNLNVVVDTVGQINIKNNLAEVYVKGSGLLAGDILNPEITVRIDAIPSVSKFKFKGNDFILNQGNVDIRDKSKNRSSELKFIGLSKINDYSVTLDISGSLIKPIITLSSEPALAQEDLLSLLTLGVTSDMSKNLVSGERKSVTTVSLGTLLVDQLKINEDLNSTLGLKLSVQPEFKEDETSLVQGKSAVSDSASSKLKSATKIKITKPINKSVDVSVSSTVGGSIEQTQEVNINYNINKKFSLDGIYEVKPVEENINTPNSLGADLKYKWSF